MTMVKYGVNHFNETTEYHSVVVYDICFQVSKNEVFDRLRKFTLKRYWAMVKKIAFEKYDLWQYEQQMIAAVESV